MDEILVGLSARADNCAATPQASENDLSNVSDQPKPLTEFTLFPKFPYELRRKIWKHAISIPEHLEVTIHVDLEDENKEQDNIFQPIKFFTHNQNTSINANRESRETGLMLLPASLPTLWKEIELRFNPVETTVYVNNFANFLDILEENGGDFLLYEAHRVQHIRKVALDTKCLPILLHNKRMDGIWEGLLYNVFPDLKELCVLLDEADRGAMSKEDVEEWHLDYTVVDVFFEVREEFYQLKVLEGKLRT